MKLKEKIDGLTMSFSGAAVLIPIYGILVVAFGFVIQLISAIQDVQNGAVNTAYWGLVAGILISLVLLWASTTYTPAKDKEHQEERPTATTRNSENTLLLTVVVVLSVLAATPFGTVSEMISEVSIHFTGPLAFVALFGFVRMVASLLTELIKVTRSGWSRWGRKDGTLKEKGGDV